jgi:hypothetical protein
MPHSFSRCLQLVDFVGQLFKLPPVFNRRLVFGPLTSSEGFSISDKHNKVWEWTGLRRSYI